MHESRPQLRELRPFIGFKVAVTWPWAREEHKVRRTQKPGFWRRLGAAGAEKKGFSYAARRGRGAA